MAAMPNSPRPMSASGRKVERSCAVCHRRKVRCDKQSPCSQCTRGGYSCIYPPVGPVVRRARKTTINDVASRISELEKTLIAVSQDHELPAVFKASPRTSTPISEPERLSSKPPDSERGDKTLPNEVLFQKGSASHYFNEVLLSRVIEQEHDVRTALATPKSLSPPSFAASPFSAMGIISSRNFAIPLAAYHPTRLTATQLWKTYVDKVDPCTKIIHVPTDEILLYTVVDDPTLAPTEVLGLCFAIYFSATVTLEATEAAKILGEDRTCSLHRFKAGLEQCLAEADFLDNPSVKLLQAVAIYLTALRVHNTSRSVWTLNGLALRAAQSIGLHRDGTKLGLSPFDSEIRRRLWWHLVARDGRAAEDYGLQNPYGPAIMCSVDLPRNLEDADLTPDMKHLPPERTGWTRMTLALVSIDIARGWSQLLSAGWMAGHPPSEEDRARIVAELRNRVEEKLKYCNAVVPQQRLCIRVSRFILRKLDLVTRQQWQSLQYGGDAESLATEENLTSALSVLEQANELWNDELLLPFRWTLKAYPQFHMLLYVLWHLCVYPNAPMASRAFAAAASNLEEVKSIEYGPMQGSKWTVLTALKNKALRSMAEQQNTDAAAQTQRNKPDNCMDTAYPNDRDGAAIDEFAGASDLQALPDWGSLLQDFQLDVTDFSQIF